MAGGLSLAGRAIGIVCGATACLVWLAAIWFPGNLSLSGASLLVAFTMMILSVVAAVAAYHGHGTVLLVIFFVSFFPVGAYVLSLPDRLRWVGLLNLGYLVAGLLLWRFSAAKAGRADQ